jgi:hypothetical protein
METSTFGAQEILCIGFLFALDSQWFLWKIRLFQRKVVGTILIHQTHPFMDISSGYPSNPSDVCEWHQISKNPTIPFSLCLPRLPQVPFRYL